MDCVYFSNPLILINGKNNRDIKSPIFISSISDILVGRGHDCGDIQYVTTKMSLYIKISSLYDSDIDLLIARY